MSAGIDKASLDAHFSGARTGLILRQSAWAFGSGAGAAIAFATISRRLGAGGAESIAAALCVAFASAGLLFRRVSYQSAAQSMDRALGTEVFGASLARTTRMTDLCIREALERLSGISAFKLTITGVARATAGPLLGIAVWFLLLPAGASGVGGASDSLKYVQLSARVARAILQKSAAGDDSASASSEILTLSQRWQSASETDRRDIERKLEQLLLQINNKENAFAQPRKSGAAESREDLARDLLQKIESRSITGAETGTGRNGAVSKDPNGANPEQSPGASAAPDKSNGQTASPDRAPSNAGVGSDFGVTIQAQSWPERYDWIVRRYFASAVSQPKPETRPSSR
ncbi:MAG: hypothetical protein HY286_16015 [Planctomycetes bacterium]|nr:hypothetical protein [Planctomycetota bacterium]